MLDCVFVVMSTPNNEYKNKNVSFNSFDFVIT